MTSLNDCNALCELLVKTIASGKFEAQKPEFDRTAFVADELKKIGCFVETKIIENTPNVIAYFGNKNAKKSICFCGHCDVVPVFNNWSKNYKGEIVGDRVYGRGAVDMLGGVVCWLYALQQLSPDILERVKIATILTGDEEGYGTNGIIKFADYLKQKGLNSVRCDNNDVLVDNFKVASGAEAILPTGLLYICYQISINQDLEVIKYACTKPMIKVPKALSEYGITTEEIEKINKHYEENKHTTSVYF